MKQALKFVFYWILTFLILEISFVNWLLNNPIATFGTNDDALISNIFNGYFGTEYQFNLVFIQPLIVFVIKLFQSILVNSNIYSHFLLFTAIASYSSIFAHFFVVKSKLIKFISISIFVLFTLTFITWFSINPTYTGASLIAVGASTFHLLNATVQKNGKLKIFLTILGSLFLILGYLIRKESLFIFLILFIPLFIYLQTKSNFRQNVKYITISISIFFSALILNLVAHNHFYSSQEWKNYEQMNNARHQIQLRAPEVQLENKLDFVNWNKDTYQLFLRMALIDQTQMNKEKMQQILNVTHDYVGPKSLLRTTNTNFISQIVVSFQPWTWILKLLLLSVGVIFLSLLFNRKLLFDYLIQISILVIPIFILLAVLSNGYQLPERITLNLLAASFPIVLIPLINNQTQNLNTRKPIIFVLSALLLFGSWQYYKRFAIETQARTNFYASRISYAEQQKTFMENLSQNIVLMGSSSVFKSDWQFPYSRFKPFDQSQRIVYLGWHNLSPLWINFLETKKIDGSNFPESYFEESLIYVESPENFESLKRYLINSGYKFEVKELGLFGPSDYYMYKFNLI